ncbi:hypothetical protein D1AOALGA4SA_10274 [Olavius algarvensis Delta 1 endosymbiont]|nr:hypothetical protein D1AOALGA4SA_10274 [Olavius algarvensis Delta 1 endosymbiont]
MIRYHLFDSVSTLAFRILNFQFLREKEIFNVNDWNTIGKAVQQSR